jgi:isoprenylcysteine carboxyl methyltransferase (ICMT) family protein YpbQ
MRHPNYLGVMGELVGMALMAHAPIAGSASTVVFGALIAARIRVEERALGLRD